MNSDIIEVAVAISITVLLHALTIYGQRKRAKQLAEYVDESGRWSPKALLLEYPIGLRILAMVCMFVFLIILIYGLLVAGPIPADEMLFDMTVFLFFAVILPWMLYLEFGGTYVLLTDGGINKRSYFTGKRFIEWREVKSVSFSSTMRQFTVRSTDSRITVNIDLNGISDFAKQIRKRLRQEIWEEAKNQINGMA